MRDAISDEVFSMDETPPPLPPKIITDRQVYNLVSDTGVGVNIRREDNLYQALAIFVCTAIGAVIGCFIDLGGGSPWWAGAIVVGIGGLVVGFFASGIFLMVYLAIKHLRGEHD
jgi:hypothetical protein